LPRGRQLEVVLDLFSLHLLDQAGVPLRVERKRSGFQDMAAEGLITLEELRAKLANLEKTRKTAEREFEALKNRSERIGQLERDRDALLSEYAGAIPQSWTTATPRTGADCTKRSSWRCSQILAEIWRLPGSS
jgi:hypothetical protein